MWGTQGPTAPALRQRHTHTDDGTHPAARTPAPPTPISPPRPRPRAHASLPPPVISYVWSLDTDAFLLGPLSYDPFALMDARNASYGYIDVNVETPEVRHTNKP